MPVVDVCGEPEVVEDLDTLPAEYVAVLQEGASCGIGIKALANLALSRCGVAASEAACRTFLQSRLIDFLKASVSSIEALLAEVPKDYERVCQHLFHVHARLVSSSDCDLYYIEGYWVIRGFRGFYLFIQTTS